MNASYLCYKRQIKIFLNFELSFDIVSGSVYPGLPFSFENRLFSNFDTSV